MTYVNQIGTSVNYCLNVHNGQFHDKSYIKTSSESSLLYYFHNVM